MLLDSKAISTLAGFLVLATACAVETSNELPPDNEFDSFLASGAADGWGVAEGTAEAKAVLRVANELSQSELDAILDNRAAENIANYRAGTDGILGTGDDIDILSLEELDATPWVGPVAFGQLLEEARRRGWVSGGGGTVVVDPTGDGDLGTIVVQLPTFPPNTYLGASGLGEVVLLTSDRTDSVSAVIENNEDNDGWTITVAPGTYCIRLEPRIPELRGVGQTYRCGVTVRSGDSTAVNASLSWIGELDVMDATVGEPLREFKVTQNCAGSDCEGRLTFNYNHRSRWNQRYIALFSGDYTIEYSTPNIAPVQKRINAGRLYEDSFLPETDHRAFLYVTADPKGLPTANCSRTNWPSRYPVIVGFNAQGDRAYRQNIELSKVASMRTSEPIYYFPVPDWVDSWRLQFGEGIGAPYYSLPSKPGSSEFVHLRRAEINHVDVTVETPDGPEEQEVEGTVHFKYGDTFADDEGDLVCKQFPTGHGLDLLPGRYVADVYYSTSGGDGSKTYNIDAR